MSDLKEREKRTERNKLQERKKKLRNSARMCETFKTNGLELLYADHIYVTVIVNCDNMLSVFKAMYSGHGRRLQDEIEQLKVLLEREKRRKCGCTAAQSNS